MIEAVYSTNGISPKETFKRLTKWDYHYTPEETSILLRGVKMDTPDGKIWHYPLIQETYDKLDKYIDESIKKMNTK